MILYSDALSWTRNDSEDKQSFKTNKILEKIFDTNYQNSCKNFE